MPKYKATFPRAAAMEFARFVTTADSAAAIAAEARRIASTLPATVNKNPERPRMGWKEHFLRLASALETGADGYTIIGENGNKKLGEQFYTFSTLPIVTCPGAGACKGPCYSLKAWAYPGAFMRQAYCTILLRFNRRAVIDAFKAVPADVTFRLYVDGDFDSAATFIFWQNLLRQRPDVLCYGYSKSWEVILSVPVTMHAPNYVLNISSGSAYDGNPEMKQRMLALPITRGEFVMLPTSKNWGKSFAKYDNPEYHRDVRAVAVSEGYERLFSCSGNCSVCTPRGHACGAFTLSPEGQRLYTVKGPIGIGIH